MVPELKLTQEPVMSYTQGYAAPWQERAGAAVVSPVFFMQTSLAKLFHFPGVDFLSCYSGEHALEAVTVPEWSETGWGILPGPACLYAVRGEDGTTAQIWGGGG